MFFLLPLLRGRDEPDDVLEGEPADEDGLANCEDEMLLVLTLFALKNKKCYLLSCFKWKEIECQKKVDKVQQLFVFSLSHFNLNLN